MVGAAGLDHHGDLAQVAGRQFKEQGERNPALAKATRCTKRNWPASSFKGVNSQCVGANVRFPPKSDRLPSQDWYVAKGQSRHFAPLENSEPFVRRTTAELVADLPIGA